MAIQCPGCGVRINVSPKLEGKRIRCSVCKTMLSPPSVVKATASSAEPLSVIELDEPDTAISERRTIPSVVAVTPDSQEEELETTSLRTAQRKQRKPAARSRFRWAFLLLGACLGGVGLVGCIFAVVYFMELTGASISPHAVRVEKAPPPPPPPNLDDLLANPAPAQIDADTRRKVIRATAHIRTIRVGNVVQEGSGFFAAEQGLVFTNAHVVGMGAAGCHQPVKVDVIVNSGESDEKTLSGSVLAADWVTDLAVLRVTGPPEHWPTPLVISSSHTLSELQKVYIFGFPFGSTLGKNITASESSVSALRKDASGNIHQVQVNGGMQPGNSGGPVVDSRGLVVGVSVSMIGGTQINFAVPAEKLNGLVRGQVEDIQFGEPYLEGAETRLPLAMRSVDPLMRLKELYVDIWAGAPDAGRPTSFKKPNPLPGDGPHLVFPLSVKNAKATTDVRLPDIKPDQVLWVQPVLTDVGDTVRWAAAKHYKPTGLAPLVRAPAKLQLSLDAPAERTVKMTYVDTIKATMGGDQMVSRTELAADGLEVVRKTDTAAESHLHFGPCKISVERNGNKQAVDPQVVEALKGRFVRYSADAEGALKQRTNPNLGSTFSAQKRREFAQLVQYIANAYEDTCLPMPNRLLQPRETWEAVVRLTPGAGPANGELELRVNCTYEGRRTIQDDNQAVITVAGVLWGEVPVRPIGGVFTGRVYFSIDKGHATRADFKLEHEFGRGNMFTSRIIEVSLTRALGNSLGIVAAKPVDVKKGKTVFETTTALSATNGADLSNKPGCFVKNFSVMLAGGQTYVIEMSKAGESELDPYLVLKDPGGMLMAEDDDDGGVQNARIICKPAQSAAYVICATSCDPGQVGPFRLVVSEEISGAGGRK